ncbi:helix-turn-helix domain-containing protein [Draconibacterium orientale]|uniref:helix-turn-helix domain-containing protein n=1 Tax=Draconibacterium orientale TaxID=1168034 RepID=UPI0029C03F6A|nr:helix-turn-helix domain-containing protein [Draconibacterium orientale]
MSKNFLLIDPDEFWDQFDTRMNELLKDRKENPKKIMRSAEVRAMLNISDSTLQSMRISGAIPASKIEGTWFYYYDDIIDALERGRTNRKDGLEND